MIAWPITDVILQDSSLVSGLITFLVRSLRAVLPVGAHGLFMQPPVLINRFMINLRSTNSGASDYSVRISDWQQGQSDPQFRRPTDRLGNMEGMLQIGWDDDEPCYKEDGSAEVGGIERLETSAEA